MRLTILAIAIMLSLLFVPSAIFGSFNNQNLSFLEVFIAILLAIIAAGILNRNTYVATAFNLLAIVIPIFCASYWGVSRSLLFALPVFIIYCALMSFVLYINIVRLIRLKNELHETKIMIEGKWKFSEYSTLSKNEINPYENATIQFNTDGTGYADGFLFNDGFKYRIDNHELIPRTNEEVDDPPYPKIIFSLKNPGRKYKLDYKFESTTRLGSKVNLYIGKEYAFNDNFRGYSDGEGNLRLMVEDYFKFERL
jgi:hypothetical protein